MHNTIKDNIACSIAFLAKRNLGVGGATPETVKEWHKMIRDGTVTESEWTGFAAQYAALVIAANAAAEAGVPRVDEDEVVTQRHKVMRICWNINGQTGRDEWQDTRQTRETVLIETVDKLNGKHGDKRYWLEYQMREVDPIDGLPNDVVAYPVTLGKDSFRIWFGNPAEAKYRNITYLAAEDIHLGHVDKTEWGGRRYER